MAEENKSPAVREDSLAVLIERPEYRNRFNDVMGARAPQFMSSVLSLHMHSMRDVDPKSILASAMTAASLNLPINPNLGFAYIVAYADRNRGGQKFAQFQLGYKGFIQLAMRTGQYRFLNACKVFEGELIRYDKVSGELVVDEEKKSSDKVVGYAGYMRLINGFEHALYMTTEQVTAHGKQYSQSFKKGYGLWVDNFESMALKTVIKLLLSKWGILSVEMERALYEDQAIKADLDASPVHLDNLAPMPRAQIEGGGTAPAPAAANGSTTEPPATTEPEPKKRGPKKKASLHVVEPPAPAEPAAPAEEKKPELGPKAKEFAQRVSDAGFQMTTFLALAVWNKWLPAPEGYFTLNEANEGDPRVPGDPADLEDMTIPEKNAIEYLEPDNWELIAGLLAKKD